MRRLSIRQHSFLTWLVTSLFAISLLLQGCASSIASDTSNFTQTIKPARSVRSLATRIREHIQAPHFAAASWGIKIISLETGRTLFEHDANKYFLPASNTKLYTGALALETFPADYRFSTDLYTTAPLIIRNSIFTGDLVLYGQGDPTLGAGEKFAASSPQPFDQLAARLAKLGIKRVRGKLIVDESYFATPEHGSGWQANDLQWYYGASVSAIAVHENTLQLSIKPAVRVNLPCEIAKLTPLAPGVEPLKIINRTRTVAPGEASSVGIYRDIATNTFYIFGNLAIDGAPIRTSLALPFSAITAGNELRAALARYQIKLEGGIKVVNWLDRASFTSAATSFSVPSSWHRIATIASPTLTQILQQTLKRSQNLYAQSLLLQVGRQAAQAYGPDACIKNGITCTTEQWGIYAINNFLLQARLPLNSVSLEEGSGLSRGNLVTPAATAALLQYMNSRPNAQIFREALPIAGVDGTLKARMRGTLAAHNVHAKTGTMRATYTLSGYVTTAAKEPLAFSIMLNNYVPPSTNASTSIDLPRANKEIDAIVIMLAEFVGHS